jgi:hypothetical protein
VPQQNYLNAFRGPNLAEIDRSAYSNALLRNERDRIPQANKAQDLAIQGDEQTLQMRGQQMTEQQKQAAAGVLARNFSLAAQSRSPREAARALISSPDFQAAGRLVGLPTDRFTVTDADTDDVMRQQLQAWADTLSGTGQHKNVARTWVNPQTQTMWALDRGGNSFDTGVPAAQFAQRPVETGAGLESFDPGRGTTGGPISPAATAPALDRAAEDRKYAENLGAGRGQNQADFEAGAPQRTERARQQIAIIDNTLNQVDRALQGIDWNTVGLVGNMSKAIPGTPAHDMQQTLLTIQANLGFDRIQQMRESSPTGGALGQVAVQELNALQASVAALAQSQSAPQFRQNLQTVKTHYENWKRVIQQSQSQPQGLPDFSQMTDEQLQKIINGQ